MDGGAEDAGLLDLRHRIEQPHRFDRIVRTDLENRPVLENLLQLLGRADRREPAGVDDRETMAVLGFVEIVRRHQHGHAGSRELIDEIPEAAPRDRIDAAGRLVEKDDRRFVENRAAERETLPPSAGQVGGAHLLAPLEARHLDDEAPPPLEPFGIEPVDAAEKPDVLIDGQPLVERKPLRHVADPALDAFRIAPDVDAADRGRAAGRLEQPAQHADRRRLAGAVAAQEPEDLALLHVERQIVDRDELAEPAGEMADGDGVHG